MKRITSTLLILLLSQMAAAEQEASSNTTSVEKVDTNGTKLSPRLSLSSTLVSNRRDINKDPDAVFYNSTNFGLSLKSNKTYRWAFGVGFNKNLTGERKLDWGDGSVSVSRGLARPNEFWNISGKVSTIIPLAKSTKAYSELNGLIGIQPVVSWDASQVGAKGLSLAYIPKFTTYFYEHETNVYGSSNNQFKTNHTLSVDYSFTDKLSANFTSIYIRSWTHKGQRSDSFAFDQSVTYSLSSKFWTSVGHSIGGSAIGPNGQSNNIQFYDENLSTWYLSAGLTF
ncbi:hypothetical protein [Halobacteriovorax sp. HLS]|uniref:hypothetical protein n=1 Tax=Halobacteriovorax sp. HLS TaxID=2234000 RepID=UPI000FDB2102|nr:hypothetical protein [Halobacteriovorax sp. HLS]